MIKIHFPEKKPGIKWQDGKELIFCAIRRRWIKLTPEEWVRQNFLLYLTETLRYPSSLIAVEKQIIIAEVARRFDILVYDNKMQPFMIVECKEMGVALTQQVLGQALRYNIPVRAKYVVITNGIDCAGYHLVKNNVEEIEFLPTA